MEREVRTPDGADIYPIAMSKEQAAEAIGVSRPTIDKLIRKDETFPHFRIGKRVLISSTELINWISRNSLEQSEIRI